jgi:glycerate 2-kinase
MEKRDRSVSVEKPRYSAGKQLAQEIFFETMTAIDVRRAMLSKLRKEPTALVAGDVRFPLARPPRIVAFGKAANRMAAVLVEILGGSVDATPDELKRATTDAVLIEILGGAVEAGVVVSPSEPATRLDRFRYFTGGHPYPNLGSLQGAEAALELVSGLTADDAVIFLVSGGGSALFEKPLDPAVTLQDLFEFNRVLVTCGLRIEQMNPLRKHLSAVKGGRLGACAYPARRLTIFISDVPEDLPSIVASGPTRPDESTVEHCYSIVEEHGLAAQFPVIIRKRFEERTLEETPKAADPRLAGSQYFCLLSNRDAVAAAKAAAEELGFICEVDGSEWDADYQRVASANLTALNALAPAHLGKPVSVVAGGEIACPATGRGIGGRNQAFVLYAAMKIAGSQRVVLSAGTDGRDGNSPASGAVADGQTISRARAMGLDPEQYLAASDSYHFFRALGDTLDTGFTDNNVRDIRLWLDFGSELLPRLGSNR